MLSPWQSDRTKTANIITSRAVDISKWKLDVEFQYRVDIIGTTCSSYYIHGP